MYFTQIFWILSVVGALSRSHQSQAADPLPRANLSDVGISSELFAKIDKQIEADVAGGQMPGAVDLAVSLAIA
jgi:hypothetical protein